MAEQVTSQTWEELMEQRLFAPLNIRATFGWPTGPEAPWGHAPIDGRLTPVDPEGSYQVPAAVAPAGDISMSLRDGVVFAQLHLCGLGGQPGLLSTTTLAKLHASLGPVGNVEGDGYALGWLMQPVAGVTGSMHQGSAGTFEAVTVLLPDLDVGVIVLSNAGEEVGSAVVNAAVEQAVTPYLPG
jgi:CubicO group peptidase (beta-lactamase class C family)